MSEQIIINKRLIHNISSPLLIEKSYNIKNQFNINKSNNINKKSFFKKKLSPLITTNIKLLRNKKTLLKSLINKSLLSPESPNNDNDDDKNSKINNGKNTLRLIGELANDNAKNIMNKYFYPDGEESHEKSNQINEEIDINELMTFYSRKKYMKEREEIKKLIRNQRQIIWSDNNDDYNSINYNNNNSLLPSSRAKSVKKKLYINSFETLNNEKNIKNSSFIKLDISKKIYHSPLHSLDTIKKNKYIYDYIINNYRNNTIKSFRKLENKLKPLLKVKFNLDKKIKKVKILPFIQKMEDTNYISNNKEHVETNSQNKYNNEINKKDKYMTLDFPKLLGHKNGEKFLLKNTIQYPKKNFPESRTEFIFAEEGREFILHGGYNVSRKYNLWKFNPNEKSWSSIEPTGIKSEIRFAHTGVLHYRNLYIFGGKNFNGTNFADIEIFNLDKKCWIFPKLESFKRIPLRRNHIACGIGNSMFVHGGISEENKYLDDQYILNYKPLKWVDIDINTSNKIKVPPLAHHSCCLVIEENIRNNSKFTIYNIPELGGKFGLTNNNIKEKGIYIFGGKISNDGELNNNIYILKIGKKPLEWAIINTNGSAPCARYDSSLNFYERGNMLIIHGGRNIHNVFNDTFILDLFTLNWIEVEYFNRKIKVPPRYFHQAIIIKGELYVFGGIDGKKYIGSEMFVLDLNSNSRCLKEKEEKDLLDKLKILNEKNNKKNSIKKNSNNKRYSVNNGYRNHLFENINRTSLSRKTEIINLKKII